MNDIISIAIQHHFYILPLGVLGMWLLTRWGAEPKRGRAPAKETARRAKVLPPARISPQQGQGRSESPEPLSDLKARSDSLALWRAELEQQIAALDSPKVVESRRRDKRKRNR